VDAGELLTLVFARPRQVLAAAEVLLDNGPTDGDASIAHQAIGIVYREYGDVTTAVAHLRCAVRLASRSGSPDREADVLATLGIALIQAGRTAAGLAALDRAVTLSRGQAAARVAFRRGGALWILGRYREALADVGRAIPVLRRGDDPVWTARALNFRALIHTALGAAHRADDDLREAGKLFADTGQEHDLAYTVHNRGLVAFRLGDLPTALAYLDDAEGRFRRLGTPNFGLHLDRSEVLLAAGLSREALVEADRAVARLDHLRGQATRRAQLLLAAAEAALACADHATAIERAGLAARMFATQRRPWWRARAQLLLLQARFANATANARLMAEAADVAVRLAEAGSAEATQAYLLAGRIALALSRPADAERYLTIAAQARQRGPALVRVSGWLAEALRAEAAGLPRRLLHACRRGLDVLDEHRLTLGAIELRALASAYGAELAGLAQRSCLHSGQTRRLLRWSERGRSAALAIPPVQPPGDRALQARLTAFRAVSGRLDSARLRGQPVDGLHRQREHLEREIRAHTMRIRGTGADSTRHSGLDIGELLDRLGDGQLIEIVEVDGALQVLVCGAGTIRRMTAGSARAAAVEVDFARAGLRRLAHAPASGDRQLGPLNATARRLEEEVLGPVVRYLGDQPIALVPPGRLHGLPWALLPSLRERVHSVAPSAAAWLQAAGTHPLRKENVVLVRGPGLRTGGTELPGLARIYDTATVLEGGAATASSVLAAIEGSRLAHIAAHGTFRMDSPLFSALRLADGPLTVHDLARLRRAPYRLVLPSCDSGQLSHVGADDLLGFAVALLPLGTAGIVASLLPVNDEATVALVLALHDGLRRGATMAHALRDARIGLIDGPVNRATGSSFVAIGPA
jgi:tetratricopeptide (TPR) repeat protein